LPRSGTRDALYQALRVALAKTAQRAHCSGSVTPHPLRHTFASEMIRLGMSLPALMQLLGHKDIRMTLRYVQITQVDLHREYHAARRNAVEPHRVPVLAAPNSSDLAGPAGICQAVAATRHLLEMYRRQLSDANSVVACNASTPALPPTPPSPPTPPQTTDSNANPNSTESPPPARSPPPPPHPPPDAPPP